MVKKDFKNIQVQARPELFTMFEDTFQQSGANSKGEFLGMLLENYLNPDYDNALKKAQTDFNKEREALENEKKSLTTQLANRQQFSPRISELLGPVLKKFQKQKAYFKTPEMSDNEEGKGKGPVTEEVEINTLEDALYVVLKSIKIE
jgi:hypothetical protein